MIEENIVAQFGRFADDYAHSVINEQPFADLGPGMNLNTSQKSCKLRDQPRGNKPAQSVQTMRDPMQHHCMQAGVAEKHLKCVLCGRIFALDGADVLPQRCKHGFSYYP